MRRLIGWVVICSLSVAVVATNAGPAFAAKGGNSEAAKACQHGGWRVLVSASGGPFASPGDCVNDGAQGLGGIGHDPEVVCEGLSGGTFTWGNSDPVIFECQFNTPPESSTSQLQLENSCSGVGGALRYSPPSGGTTVTECVVLQQPAKAA